MKRLLVVLLLFPVTLNAQKSYSNYSRLDMMMRESEFDNSFYLEPFAPLKKRKELGISGIQVTTTGKRGKVYKTQMTYNKMGRMTHSESKFSTIDKYYQDDSLETHTVFKMKRKTNETKRTFHNGKVISTEQYENGKLVSRVQLAYNPAGKVAHSKMVKGRKTFEIQNSYHENGELARTVYLVNGKVNKEWVYECKPEGEVVAVKKTEVLSSYCTYQEESADGSYITYTRSLRNGRPYLLKEMFTRDSVRIGAQRFRKDSVLVWEMNRINNREELASYKKSGKQRYRQVTVFDDSGNVLAREYFTRSKKSTSKTVFELNPDGTTKTRQYFAKGKPLSKSEYVYRFH